MPKKLDKFIDLTRQALAEEPPRIDVRGKVLATISASQNATNVDQIAMRFLVGSMSLALVTVMAFTIFASQEPPVEMIMPFVSRLP